MRPVIAIRWEGNMAINIIFDGPPGPESGRFVEVETDDGRSINAGEWIERPDGLWALRITSLQQANAADLCKFCGRGLAEDDHTQCRRLFTGR